MTADRTEPHLVRYVSQEDVQILMKRIPVEQRSRLRDVFISDRHHGVQWLGSVRTRGRRDIDLYAILPPRVSLGQYLMRNQRGIQFGAPSRGQWPPWAVRRFMLYDVFLHELGHLQVVLPKSTNWKRKYAGEKLAQDFADGWRAKLWAEHFDHPDPIHNRPGRDELETIRLWERLDKPQRFRLVDLVLNAPFEELPDLSFLGDMTETQHAFLCRAFCGKGERPAGGSSAR